MMNVSVLIKNPVFIDLNDEEMKVVNGGLNGWVLAAGAVLTAVGVVTLVIAAPYTAPVIYAALSTTGKVVVTSGVIGGSFGTASGICAMAISTIM